MAVCFLELLSGLAVGVLALAFRFWSSLDRSPFLASVALAETCENSKVRCGGSFSVSFGKRKHVGAF